MKMCFLGHQSWLLEGNTGRVLLDPLLLDSFGTNGPFGLQVYPPRNVAISELPEIGAVVLSHEHSDHLHLPSLDRLPRTVVFYLGALVVEPVAVALRGLGFEVRRVRGPEVLEVGDLRLRLYLAPPETALWESRVHQLYVQQIGCRRSLFVCVDALLSERFVSDVSSGRVTPPAVIAVSNNSQITPPGVVGALQNLAADPLTDGTKQGPLGLQVLRSLVASVEALPPAECLVICGGGFMKNYDNFGPFPFSDQDSLGELGSALCDEQTILGLLPGQVLCMGGASLEIASVPWIQRDEERHALLEAQRARFLAEGRVVPKQALTGGYSDQREAEVALTEVETELVRLAPHLLLSPLGRHLLLAASKAGPASVDAPFAMVLTDCWDGGSSVHGLSLVSGRFEPDPVGAEAVMARYPYGLRISLRDFQAVIRGEIQIWDLAGIAMHGWFSCPMFESPVAFMYSFYGENCSPDLLQVALERQLSDLESRP